MFSLGYIPNSRPTQRGYGQKQGKSASSSGETKDTANPMVPRRAEVAEGTRKGELTIALTKISRHLDELCMYKSRILKLRKKILKDGFEFELTFKDEGIIRLLTDMEYIDNSYFVAHALSNQPLGPLREAEAVPIVEAAQGVPIPFDSDDEGETKS